MTAVGDDGSLVVADANRGLARLPAACVARHVNLGWAVTGYGTHGVTTDHAIAMVEASSTRAGIYVAMTRGRGRNVAWIMDRTGLADAEEALAAAIARPTNALSAHAVAARLGGETPAKVMEDDMTTLGECPAAQPARAEHRTGSPPQPLRTQTGRQVIGRENARGSRA